MRQIHVAVVGLGYWGPNLIRNFSKIPGVSVTYGCDLNRKNIRKLTRQYPSTVFTNDYAEILNNPVIDLIAIATPVSTHFQLADAALRAKKHVLIEKPICLSSQEVKQLISVARKVKKQLFSGHTFVYSEAVKKMKRMVEENELGKIYYYDSTRINLGLLQQDVNVVWDLAAHDLAILSFLFPTRPVSVQAFGSSFVSNKREEIAHIFIRFEDKMIAHIHVSWLSPVKIRTILVGGSKKMIVYNDIEPSEKIRVYDKSVKIVPSKVTPFSPAYRSGSVMIPHLEQNEALYTELSHFVECLRENRKPQTGTEEGLRVVSLLEAIDKAVKSKKEIKLHYA